MEDDLLVLHEQKHANWKNARRTCGIKRGFLVKIDTEEKQRVLNRTMRIKGKSMYLYYFSRL